MKTLIASMVIFLFAGTAFAAPLSKLGFRALSSASSKKCTVFGMLGNLKTDITGKAAIQGFSPDDTLSRNYTLGTKGYGNYSCAGKTAVVFTCIDTTTNALTPVKVYMNNIETYYLTQDSGEYIIGK